jgi:hypothetical protein
MALSTVGLLGRDSIPLGFLRALSADTAAANPRASTLLIYGSAIRNFLQALENMGSEPFLIGGELR